MGQAGSFVNHVEKTADINIDGARLIAYIDDGKIILQGYGITWHTFTKTPYPWPELVREGHVIVAHNIEIHNQDDITSLIGLLDQEFHIDVTKCKYDWKTWISIAEAIKDIKRTCKNSLRFKMPGFASCAITSEMEPVWKLYCEWCLCHGKITYEVEKVVCEASLPRKISTCKFDKGDKIRSVYLSKLRKPELTTDI